MIDSVTPEGMDLPDGKAGSSASLAADSSQSDSASSSSPSDREGEPTRRRSRGPRRRRRPSEAKNDAPDSTSVATDEPARGEAAGEDEEKPNGRRPRRSRGGARRSRSRGARNAAEKSPEKSPESATEDAREKRTSTRKTVSRKGRRTSSRSTEEAQEVAPSNEGVATSHIEDDPTGTAGKKRRRGSRGGRRRKKSQAQPGVVEAIPGEENELFNLDEFGGSGTRAVSADADESASGTSSARGSRKRKTSRTSGEDTQRATRRTRLTEEKAAAQEAERTQVILVNASQSEEVRVAVCEEGKILDFQMVVDRYNSLVNDIYRGRVVNIEAPIGAAFIDFGQGRNGFLHASDVLSAYGDPDWNLGKLLTTRVEDDEWGSGSDAVDSSDTEKTSGRRTKSNAKAKRSTRRFSRPRLPITDLFKKGQMVAAQITKDAIGDKGPTLTTFISIPGRYLVLMPSLARTGVSRKIEDEKERRRLKRILTSLNIQDGMGVIVRTAGIGKKKSELRRDLDYLMAVWQDFGKRLVSGRNPAPLYEESSVAIRTMRDLFNAKTKSVIVDDPAVHKSMVEFAEALMPEHVERIRLHDGQRPLFHAHGIEQEFERVFSRRLELPSGGSIVFDQTEALVAIDVNSGRTREGSGFEDVALKANIEAAPEIARQIRLRDLGGILVVDFIDMMRSSSRLAVEREFRQALVGDRARSKVGRISQFGLLEMTRQRLGPGLSKLIFDPCTECRGSGRQRTAGSRAQAILRRLGSALTQKGFSTVEVRTHPEVIEYLQTNAKDELEALKATHNRTLKFTSVPEQVEDSVLRYLRTDGREVRPGGRRKR